MKCPSCNSEIKMFQDKEHGEPWYCYSCKNCGAKLRLDGRRKFFSNMLILAIGLSIATFLEFSPFISATVAISTIAYVGRNLYELTPFQRKE